MADLVICRSLDCLHPLMKDACGTLLQALLEHRTVDPTFPVFAIFETYRAPERQDQLLLGGSTRAKAWQSAHQYGLAADFVPLKDNEWTWEAEPHVWAHLRTVAHQCGLRNEIAWDRPHVEHPAFLDIKNVWRKRR